MSDRQQFTAGSYAIERESEAKARQVSQLNRGAEGPSPSIEGDGDFGRVAGLSDLTDNACPSREAPSTLPLQEAGNPRAPAYCSL
jgi:hypothetical protein